MIARLRSLPYWTTLPAICGIAALWLGTLVIPQHAELNAAIQHAMKREERPAYVAPLLPPRTSLPQDWQAFLKSATPLQIAKELRATDRAGSQIALVQTAHDLIAHGRSRTALEVLKAASSSKDGPSWEVKQRLAIALGDRAFSNRLLDAALTTPGLAPHTGFISLALAIGRPEAVLAAGKKGEIGQLNAQQAITLAGALYAKSNWSGLDLLEDLAPPGWQSQAPWLAYQIARDRQQWDKALQFSALLPPVDAAKAKLAILQSSGDRQGLAAHFQSATPRSTGDALFAAENLLRLDMRGNATRVLETFLSQNPQDKAVAARLLFLLGPRPAKRDLDWLKQQAGHAGSSESVFWTQAYVERESPVHALPYLANHPAIHQTDYALLHLAIARQAQDTNHALKALNRLIDGRHLSKVQAEQMVASLPSNLPKETHRKLLEWRIDKGLAAPKVRMELAWLSWNAQNIPQAVSWLEKHLAIYPNDAAAVRHIADCHSKLGNKAAARRWNEKLLDLAPSRSKLQADAFERLAQFEQALKIVSSLRTTQPEDAALKRQQVRLLLALGRPGDARRALP